VFHGVGWLGAGIEPVLTGNRHPSIAPYGVFGCADADIVIAVDVVGAPVPGPDRIPNTIDLTIGASQILMQQIVSLKLRQWRPHILLRPPVSRFKVLDFLKIGSVMSDTRSMKEEAKRAVEAAITEWEHRAR
jgi:NTE family protein